MTVAEAPTRNSERTEALRNTSAAAARRTLEWSDRVPNVCGRVGGMPGMIRRRRRAGKPVERASLRSPLRVLQKRQQIGEFLPAQLFIQSLGHHRYGPRTHFSDIGARQAHLGVWARGDDEFIGRVLAQHA